MRRGRCGGWTCRLVGSALSSGEQRWGVRCAEGRCDLPALGVSLCSTVRASGVACLGLRNSASSSAVLPASTPCRHRWHCCSHRRCSRRHVQAEPLRWQRIVERGQAPEPRKDHTAVVWGSSMVVYGGEATVRLGQGPGVCLPVPARLRRDSLHPPGKLRGCLAECTMP